MGDNILMGPVRTADARAYQASYLRAVPDAPVPSDRPEQRAATENARIGAAMTVVRGRYTGPVREVLLDALSWHQAGGSRVSPSSLPARLVDDLLRPPDVP